MPELKIIETFPYKAQELIDMTLDAERYSEISPWIKNVQVNEIGSDKKRIDTKIQVPSLPFTMNYVCELEKVSGNKIKAVATKCSPFKSFSGELEFKTLPCGSTQVICQLRYKRSANPLSLVPADFMSGLIKNAIKDTLMPYLAQKLEPIDEQQTGPKDQPPTYRPQ